MRTHATDTSAALQEEAQHRAAQKAARIARVLQLRAEGYGPTLIAQRMGLSRTAVNKYLRESADPTSVAA
jgi:DNA-binding CsgD family transcriptional regulator